MTHASIDSNRCQGHGRCAIIAPQVFDVDDYGIGFVLVDPVDAHLSDVKEAVASCPETAITTSN